MAVGRLVSMILDIKILVVIELLFCFSKSLLVLEGGGGLGALFVWG